MVKLKEPQPKISNRFRANIFWMGKAPLIKGKGYKLKVASARASVQVEEIANVIDALGIAELGKKNQIDMYDVAEIVFETAKPIAFDLASELANTGRFVLVDDYEISAGGVILESLKQDDVLVRGHIKEREFAWVRGLSAESRSVHYRHKPAIVFIVGAQNTGKVRIAQTVEEHLVRKGLSAYYLGIANVISGLSSDVSSASNSRDEYIRRLGELARIMYDAGLIFIATVSGPEAHETKILTDLCFPAKPVIIAVSGAEIEKPDLELRKNEPEAEAAGRIFRLLNEKGLIDVWPSFPSI
jgi:bifunctional enzyme CysN/CysC